MSSYTQLTFFAPKDSLLTGNAAKLIKGADIDPELAAIAAAIATKLDSSSAANPTGLAKMTATNGSLSTYMRSDGAPAIDPSIVPTWTGIHTFSAVPIFSAGATINAAARVVASFAQAAQTFGNATDNPTFSFAGSGILSAGDQAGVAHDVGWRDSPVRSVSGGYVPVLADRGFTLLVSSGGVTLPANGTTAFPVGSVVSVYNNSGGNITLAITTDQLVLAGSNISGSRTLNASGLATFVKIASTAWVVSGAGLS